MSFNVSGKKVFLVPILKDNYVFIIVNDKNQGLIVDPGSSVEVLQFLENMRIAPVGILITHSHPDHIGGLEQILEKYSLIPIINNNNRDTLARINLYGFKFEIIDSPGHLKDHIMFYESDQKWLFCGDVLFRYGCGRIFDGTYEEMYSSLKKIKVLPKQTLIYCTHEYTLKNFEFCLKHGLIEQGQVESLKEEALRIPSIPFVLGSELKINPFLGAESVDQFRKLRVLRNSF